MSGRVAAPCWFLRVWNRRHWLLFLTDLLAIVASFLGAYYLRFRFHFLTSIIPFQTPEIPLPAPYFKIAVLTGLVWVFLLWKEGSYRKDLCFATPRGREIRSVLISGLTSMLLIMVLSFMYRYFLLSRVTYVTAFVLACGLLCGGRWFFRLVERQLSGRGLIVTRILCLGNGPSMNTLLSRYQKLNVPMEIVGRLLPQGNTCAGGNAPPGMARFDTFAEMERIYAATPFNQVIIGNCESGELPIQGFSSDEIICAVNFCEEKNVSVYMVPDFLEITVKRSEVGSVAGVPLIRLQDSSLHPGYAPLKRFLDVIISLCVLVLGLPLWVVAALLIKLTSKGPVFYVQERAGMHGKPFQMLKFRSMVDGAERMLEEMVDLDALEEPVFKFKNDPRVTRIGKVLRRTSFDEIPQLINVLLGFMSLVGPRPEQVDLVERYNPYQRRRLKAKPGLTGYQQIMSRGDQSLAKRVEYDLYYMKYQSFLLDFYIMLKTIVVIVKGDGMR